MRVIAIDLGGTKVEVGVVELSGSAPTVVSSKRLATGPDSTPETLTAVLVELLAGIPEGEYAGIGIGSAGPIDMVAGTVSPLNMTGIREFPILEVVREVFPAVPVRLSLDAGALALAENRWGATQSARASIAMVVSTGIGAGIVYDGSLVHGGSGNAGHIGQLVLGERTLERTASGPASVEWAAAQGFSGSDGMALGTAALAGDPIARAAIERSARAVGFGLAQVCSILDVEIIAISGGFAQVAPDYLAIVQDELRAKAAHDYVRRTRVVPSELGLHGPLLGAAALVL